MSRLPKLKYLIPGLIAVALGLTGLGFAFLARSEYSILSRWPLIVWGLGFLLTGLALLDILKLLGFNQLSDKQREAVYGGLIITLAGLTLIAISLLDERDAAFHAGRWVVTLAGVIFLLGGLFVFRWGFNWADPDGLIDTFFTAMLLTCFTGVAIGVTISLDTFIGKLIVMPGALILAGLALFNWWRIVKKLIKRRQKD
jgi:hypothetical protein